MDFNIISKQNTQLGIAGFWKALDIFLNNPHLVSRRILASTKLICEKTAANDSLEITNNPNINLPSEFIAALVKKLQPNGTFEFISNDLSIDSLKEDGTYLLIRKLLPKNNSIYSTALDAILIDRSSNSITHLHKEDSTSDKQSLSVQFPYRLQLIEDNVILSIGMSQEEAQKDRNVQWMKNEVFTKFQSWMKEDEKKNSLVKSSLSLISVDRYATVYNDLKTKYGEEIIKIWPENTDPLKFVYEDIAIATYLLLLWEKERHEKNLVKKQTFVDLGCGNGLLVNILASEGHDGVGIDLRKRKIWDCYPDTTRLEVRTIVPSSSNVFPETDWLIGNHSDELTPWIPVIAARSSKNCRFFVLPCCPYEFDGRKYRRDDPSSSQYTEYMRYVKSVSERCGFVTEIDRLRIPSTKRICLIGWDKSVDEVDDTAISVVINERSTVETCNDSNDQWLQNFKPREVKEKVRNCTQLDRGLIADIIKIVADHLLSENRPMQRNSETKNSKTWNAGGDFHINQIASLVGSEKLKQLKSECGGLQTLLKNNGHIFFVRNGVVRLRRPEDKKNVAKKRNRSAKDFKIKVKPCWFYENHPDGCPVSDKECTFKH